MPTALHCPACNHHIGNLAVVDLPVDREDQLVADWLAANPWQGRRLAAEVYEQFSDSVDVDISSKAFGMALRRLGVEPRRTGAARYYVR